jgi:hypothetical protein
MEAYNILRIKIQMGEIEKKKIRPLKLPKEGLKYRSISRLGRN